MNIQDLGRAGETIARACYQVDGFECLQERYRRGGGELDLVLRRGGLIVFVEVKTRRGDRCGRAVEAVTAQKLRRMRRAAREFIHADPAGRAATYRFDVAAVDFTSDLAVCRIELLRGVL